MEVWPENWPAFSLFVRMQTQWLCGMNGPTGLNYASLFALIDRMELSKSESSDLFDDMQTLEIAALNAMAEKGD